MLEGVWMINYIETNNPTGIYIKLSDSDVSLSCDELLNLENDYQLNPGHSAIFSGLIEKSRQNQIAKYSFLGDLYDKAEIIKSDSIGHDSQFFNNQFTNILNKVLEKFKIKIKPSQIIKNRKKIGYQMSLTEIECHGDIQPNKNTKTKQNKREELSYDQLRASETISIWYTGDQYSFCYNPDELNLIGREEELKTLVKWAETVQPIGMYAIFGESGCGKSRLAFELCRELERKSWNTIWADRNTDETGLKDLIKNTEGKLLIVFDDVQFYVQLFTGIYSFFRTILKKNNRLSKIRIVITAYKEFDELRPYNSTNFKDFYNSLKLKSIEKNDLERIIQEFVRSQSEQISNTEDISLLILSKLNKLSIEEAAPLYARFMVDAICKGKNINDWAQKDILDYIINSNDEKIGQDLIDIFGYNASNVIRIIRTIATICRELSFEELKDILKIDNKEHQLWNLLQKSAILDPESGILLGIKPDIVGFYYCQNTLMDRSILSDQEFNQVMHFFVSHWTKNFYIYFIIMSQVLEQYKVSRFDFWDDERYHHCEMWTCEFMQECKRYIAIRYLTNEWDEYVSMEETVMEDIISHGHENYLEKINLWRDNLFYGIPNSKELDAEIKAIPYDFTAYKHIELTEVQKLECQKRATKKLIFKYSDVDALSNRNSEIVDTIILGKIDSKAISYNGPTLWGLPYGKGTLIFEDGTIYDGLVDKYRMIGNGTFRHPDDRQYSCHLNKWREGQGTYIWTDGARYDGNWHIGLRDGEGTMIYPNGAKVHGTWEKDVYVGDIPEGIDDDKYKVSLDIATGDSIGSIIDNNA